MTETVSIKIKRGAYDGIREVAADHRLSLLEAATVLLNGWAQLTEAQRVAAIRAPDPQPRRKRHPIPA